ncbi:unnamed protein product [Schistosoma haematobium]|nr:unnamed protein product [Schistosoma haematobium]
MKRKEEFLYNSLDIDVAEMQAGNNHVQYLKFRLFDKFVSPIANSSHLETSPSTSESKHVGGAIADQLHTVHKETRDRFMAMVTRLSSDDPKTSTRDKVIKRKRRKEGQLQSSVFTDITNSRDDYFNSQ